MTEGLFVALYCDLVAIPPPLYNVWDKLINEEWHTEGGLDMNGNEALLHGFYVGYDVCMEHNGKKTNHRIRLTKSGKKSLNLMSD